MKKIFLLIAFYFSICGFVFADVPDSDLNKNGIDDKSEAEVILDANVSLPAGEYFFNNLIIKNNAVLTILGDQKITGTFKGVKINAVNLTIDEGSSISADGQGYDYGGGYGEAASVIYYAGASYGGVGLDNVSTSTYGSAVYPFDLGSFGYSKGGGAIQIIVSGTLTNNGEISARGDVSASGGSIYVKTNKIEGAGTFNANGGGLYGAGYFKAPGGGGRIAIHYQTSTYTGNVKAEGGWGSYDSWTRSYAENGTVGYFDDLNNDLIVDSYWRFQKNDSPMNFNHIILTNNAKVTTEDNVNITANELLIDKNSSFTLGKDVILNIAKITVNDSSVLTLSGKEKITASNLFIMGTSTVTVLPEQILFLEIPNITISTGSSISANGRGYSGNSGPGAPPQEISYAGASYGGVGAFNYATSTYGSE